MLFLDVLSSRTHDDGVFRQLKLLRVRSCGLKMELCDLRKTARGASSPAKPALHIPELLVIRQHFLMKAFIGHFGAALRPLRLAMGAVTRRLAVLHSPSSIALGESYPLSMTSAATSSVEEQH